MTTTTIQTWAFMVDELSHFEACHAEDEFVALLPGEKIGVIVHRNGTATNRYSDGRTGVPEFVQRLAEKDDILYRQRKRIAAWRQVEVDAAGWPVRLCDGSWDGAGSILSLL